MSPEELRQVAIRYEQITKEHRKPPELPNREVDICGHLHAEVSELFNVLRKKKGQHEGMSYEEGILDELADILCIWSCAVNLLAPATDVGAIVENAAHIFQQVAIKKCNKHIAVENPRDLAGLVSVARQYEEATKEHHQVDKDRAPDTDVDVCSHLHNETSDLFNLLRRRTTNDGSPYSNAVADALADILCLWFLNAVTAAPDLNLDNILTTCSSILGRVARQRGGKEDVLVERSPYVSLPQNYSPGRQPGADVRRLHAQPDRGPYVLLTRFAPGTEYKSFRLRGDVEYFVVEGTLRLGKTDYPSGSFIKLLSGEWVEPSSETGCVTFCRYECRAFRADKD